MLHTVQRRKANWIGHILRRNCLLKHIIRRIDVTGRRGRRRKQVPDSLKEVRGYWNFKDKALGRALWRTVFGGGYRPVVRETNE